MPLWETRGGTVVARPEAPSPASDETEDDGSLWTRLQRPGPHVLYKHSPHCFFSVRARRRILELVDRVPDLPVYEVDVIHDRATSNEAEERFGVRHESPQAIVFCDGQLVWHGSHGAVTVEAIVEHLPPEPGHDPS